MIDPKLLNKSAVLLKRCSTDPQIATSLKNQNVSVEQTLTENKINVVKALDLAGVSGSFPGARDDIDQIIALKRSGVHFDLLIVPSIDRFTRAGQGHGVKMFWDLENAGIVTYFVAENLFSNDRMQRYIISFMLDAAQQTVISNTRASLLGNTNSFLDARSRIAAFRSTAWIASTASKARTCIGFGPSPTERNSCSIRLATIFSVASAGT